MKFQLFLKAENLPKPTGLFRKKPHTFAVVSNVTDFGSVMGVKRHRVGVTEVITALASPEWAKVFILDHQPDQRLAIDVFHTKQEKMKNFEIHDMRYQGTEHRGIPIPKDAQQITSVLFVVDDVLNSPDGTVTLKLPGGKTGTVTAHLEVMKDDDTDTVFRFHLRGYAFPSTRKNFLERPDFFYEVYRKQKGQHTHYWALVYRSLTSKGLLSPFWMEDDITLAALCNQDLNRDLMVRIVDLDSMGGRHVLGSFETTAHGIMGAVSPGGNCDTTYAFQLTCDEGVKKLGQVIVLMASVFNPKNAPVEATSVVGSSEEAPIAAAVPIMAGENLGPVEILPPPTAQVEILGAPVLARSPSGFREYARNCPIELCMAIDFTDTNGDFRSKQSEHYLSPVNKMNSYEWSMSVVGETLRDLNPQHEYPMWGFGGSFQRKTYPIFQCGPSPKANGVKGMLTGYRSTFASTGLALGNSRKLDSILAAAASHAKKQLDAARQRQGLSYTLLTVLTVGDDSDVLSAKEKLVSIEGAPLSVLFVPIGRSSGLDDQKLQIYLANKNCRRFCACLDNGSIIAKRESTKLSEKVMQTLEDQMPEYFMKQGMSP